MTKKTEPKDGHVPKSIIDQLNEHTAGGFVLFYFNSESGIPEQIMTFDSHAHCLGLQKHIEDWSVALHDLNIESEKVHIVSACQQEDSDEDF